MKSLFWRVLGALWLALVLTGTLSFLLTRLFDQDEWLLSRHPALSIITENWLNLYQQGQTEQAQVLLQSARHDHRVFTQVFDEAGTLIASSARMHPSINPRNRDNAPPGWRRLTREVTSKQGHSFLFVHRIPRSELTKWKYGHGTVPLLFIVIAVTVLTMVSLLLTLSITKPLLRLRHAVHELGETAYQQQHLAKLAKRKDELGVLAADFNKMGQRLQKLISSQRQLLRDVSHELRSPLARLQVGLALAERAPLERQQELWPKLGQECERLDSLINEILVLARLEHEQPAAEEFQLSQLLHDLKEDCQLLRPELTVEIECPDSLRLLQVRSLLQRALDNLLRNALRFSPTEQPIEISVSSSSQQTQISVRDHGPGITNPELLNQLTQPFTREPGQKSQGHGLGLAITERAVQQLGGQLRLANHAEGGFIAQISLPNQAR